MAALGELDCIAGKVEQDLSDAPHIAQQHIVTRLVDDTQFDPSSKYHDPKASREQPRWMQVDVQLVRKTRLVGIQELRSHPELAGMRNLQRGNRLSITPVTEQEWAFIETLL
jgi:predicted RNA-binding protein with PUA-like domain